MGKKYIIELEEAPFIQHFDNGIGETIYRVKGFNSLVFDWNGLQMLRPYTEPDLDAIRKEAYDKAFEDAEQVAESGKKAMCQKGLNDAWEAVDKIFDMPCKLREQLFNRCDSVGVWDIIREYSASEAIEKIRQYEQEKEEQIQVGDEVEAAFGKATVTETKEKHVYYFYADGSYGFDEKEHVTKTGRHFPEIAEVLQKMKE